MRTTFYCSRDGWSYDEAGRFGAKLAGPVRHAGHGQGRDAGRHARRKGAVRPRRPDPNGTPGVILGSIRHADVAENAILYFVEWASSPRFAVACLGRRLRKARW